MARTGILSGGQQAVPSIEPVRALHRASLRFQTQAKQFACFLANFFEKKYGQNWNPLRRAASCPVHRAGSRAASRFTSIPDASKAVCLLSGQFFRKKIWPELESSQAGSKLSRPSSRFARCIALHFDSRRKQSSLLAFWPIFSKKNMARTGILSGGQQAVPSIEPVRALHRASLRFQTQAKQFACFLANFFEKKYGQNWNPLRRAASCPVHRAGSRAASRFTSIPDASKAVCLLSGQFFRKKIWPELESNQRHKDFQS